MADIYAQKQIIYQADPGMVESLKSVRADVHNLCGSYLNHPVHVQTIDGHTYEGILVQVDAVHVYLRVAQDPYTRQFFNPLLQAYQYNNVILPLVLFELLVIALL